MLVLKWTFLAVASVSIWWESESCSIEDFPLLPPNCGNYEGRNFNLIASTQNIDWECCKINFKFGLQPPNNYRPGFITIFLFNDTGCNLNDLRMHLVDGDFIPDNDCFCANIYERDSWVLFVWFVPTNNWLIYLGSLNQSVSETETKDYLFNWLEELHVPYHNFTDEVFLFTCTRPTENTPQGQKGQTVSLAWLLVVLIPVFLMVISIITPTLKDYMARHSNRVHPFTP